MARHFTVKEHIIDASHIREYAHATADSQDAVLKLHVKQYTPRDNTSPQKGDLTIIGAHANAFPKELYEPLWDDVYEELGKTGLRIRDIWIADAAWQGYSGVLNQLGDDPSWFDYARDITHMINTFRPPRPILAIGHSFGACALTHAALTHPRLFHALVLLEPVIAPYHTSPYPGQSFASASLARRDMWPSRAQAVASLVRSPLVRTWDPRVLDRWTQHALRDTVDGATVLTTSKHQEAFTFLRPSWPAVSNPSWMPEMTIPSTGPLCTSYPFYRPEPSLTFMCLPHLRPGLLFLLGRHSTTTLPDDIAARLNLTGTGLGGSGGLAARRVHQVTHPDRGHLLPMEDPAFCARQAAAFVKQEMDVWAAQEGDYEAWAKQPNDEKAMVSPTWKRHLGVQDRPRAKM